MTANQLKRNEIEEVARANKAKEAETHRSNTVREKTEKWKTAGSFIGNVGKAISGIFGKGKNDPSWYNLDPQLVKDVASISFNAPLGDRVATNEKNRPTFPGIMTIGFVPTIGRNGSEDFSSAANVAARNIYAFIRHANSGRSNYEAPDLFMYLYSVIDAYSYWGFLTRIYSLGLTAKGHNRYYNDGMLEACGVSASDVRQNLSKLRTYINSYALRLNTFFIPKDLTILKRRLWLNTSIFKDLNIKKSQDYMFVQQVFGRYVETTAPAGYVDYTIEDKPGVYHLRFIPGKNYTVEQLIGCGEELLKLLIESEDIGIMSGDILKAYGEAGILYIPSIAEDFHIEAVYEPEVLSQIENTVAVGLGLSFDQFNITQTQNGDVQQGKPYYTANSKDPVGVGILSHGYSYGNPNPSDQIQTNFPFDYHLLNMYKDDVTPDEVMVATRLTACMEGSYFDGPDKNTDPYYLISGYGTELVLGYYIGKMNAVNHTINWATEYAILEVVSTDSANLIETMATMGDIAKFDWAPVLYIVNADDALPLANTRDVANYASVSREALNNMHYVAVLSEFGVPLLGTKVRNR